MLVEVFGEAFVKLDERLVAFCRPPRSRAERAEQAQQGTGELDVLFSGLPPFELELLPLLVQLVLGVRLLIVRWRPGRRWFRRCAPGRNGRCAGGSTRRALELGER